MRNQSMKLAFAVLMCFVFLTAAVDAQSAASSLSENDKPSITVPNAVSVINNSELNIGGISVTHPLAASGSLPVTLYVNHGIVTVPTASGLAYIRGNGTEKVTLIGSYASINSALAGLEYHSAPQFVGADMLTISANDLGDSEYPSLDVVTGTVAINVLDRPHVIIPERQVQWTAYNTIDNAGLTISGVYIKYDSIGSNNIRVTIAQSHGNVTLNTASDPVGIEGNGTGYITVTGTIGTVNSVLSGMTYRFSKNYYGPDTIIITVMDPGNSASSSGSIDINRSAVGDVMIVNALQGLPTANGTAYKMQGFYVTYINLVNENLQAVISATHGKVTLLSAAGLEYISGNGTGSITLAGSLAGINSAVAMISYIPAQGYSGVDSITMDVTDLNTYKTASGHLTIDVAAAPGSSAESTLELNGSNIDIRPAFTPGDETAKASLTLDNIAEAASNVKQDGDGNRYIIITIAPIDGANSYKLSFPADVLTDPAMTLRIKITTPLCTVVLLSNLLYGMDTSQKEFTISLTGADSSGFTADLKTAVGNRPVIKLETTLNGLNTAWGDKAGRVLVSIPYRAPAGEALNEWHIAVWRMNSSGNVYPVTNSIYDDSFGTVDFAVGQPGKYAVSYVNKTFADLSKYAWAKEQIEALASRGIISGNTPTMYNPGANITRRDFTRLLSAALELTAETADSLYDGKAKPDAYITRQDMMIMAAKALLAVKPDIPPGSYSDLTGFSDRSKISIFARNYAGTLVKNGIISGANGKLNPAKFFSRAEAAVILYKLLQVYLTK